MHNEGCSNQKEGLKQVYDNYAVSFLVTYNCIQSISSPVLFIAMTVTICVHCMLTSPVNDKLVKQQVENNFSMW